MANMDDIKIDDEVKIIVLCGGIRSGKRAMMAHIMAMHNFENVQIVTTKMEIEEAVAKINHAGLTGFMAGEEFRKSIGDLNIAMKKLKENRKPILEQPRGVIPEKYNKKKFK